MSEFIFLMIGLMLGGCVGVVMMCLLQVSRLHNEINRKDDDNEDKEHSENNQA